MVFERLVADLLNNFLGDFVDNLDASQLNIGIWGGNVKLHSLDLKETAFDEFDLPVKLKYGRLESLVLKIPWKNLYTEPVLATIEGLQMILVPNKGIVFNEDKWKKTITEAKQKALARLEENRRNLRKPRDPEADTFTEKLIAQVVKNLQIKIRSIHIRYEDRYSNKEKPFAAGITLESLDFQTTDSNFKATIHKETLKIFYKLVSLNCLAVYWNPASEMHFLSDLEDKEAIRRALEAAIATKRGEGGKRLQQPADYKYLLAPISITSKLTINQKPESDGSDWKIPKIDLVVELDRLAFSVNQQQYQDFLLFLDSQERFQTAERYLRYRPNLVHYKGNYRNWWLFAHDCVLNEQIRRRRRNWSWEHIREHKQLMRNYRNAWVRHRTEKHSSVATDKEVIEMAETELDLFNLNIAREQAEMDIDRLGLKRLEDQEPQTWTSWAKSWFVGGGGGGDHHHHGKGGDEEPVRTPSTSKIASQFEEAMTDEERKKLFQAIDYQENLPPTDYPKKFVENRVSVKLGVVVVEVEGAMELQLKELSAGVDHRPSARAIQLKTGVKSLSIMGRGQELVSQADAAQDYLSFEFATNPLDGSFDSYIGLHVSPVVLRYHAPAINALLAVFRPPESVRLKQLAAAAMLRYEQVKAKSVAGFQHVVDRKPKVKLELRIEPATVVVTNGNFDGPFDPDKPNLVMQLGLLTMNTVDEVAEFMRNFKAESNEERRVEELRLQAANKFESALSNVSIHFANAYRHGDIARDGAFGSVEVSNCAVKGYFTNEGQIHFEAEVFSLSMEDRREETKIRKLLDKMEKRKGSTKQQQKPTSSAPTRKPSVRDQPLIHMSFDMDTSTGDKVVEVNSQRFYLLLNPEFLGALTNFFAVPPAKKGLEEAGEDESRQYSGIVGRDIDIPLGTPGQIDAAALELAQSGVETVTTSASAPKPQSSVDEPPPGTLTMKCKIRDIEVILIENALRPEESQALVLSFSSILEANNDSGIQHFAGAVQNLQIESTLYSATEHHFRDPKASYSVLEKLEIQMAGTILAETGAQDVTFSMDTVHIKVSPAVIRLLSAVATQFTTHKQAALSSKSSGNSNSTEGAEPLRTYPGYWNARNIEERKYWWFQDVAEEGDEGLPLVVSSAVPKQQQQPAGRSATREEQAKFSINRFVITIEAGVHNRTAPMILVESSLRAVARQWSSRLVAEAKVGLQVSYYNEAFSVWEPVIEPVWSQETREWDSWQLRMLVEAHGDDEMLEDMREGHKMAAKTQMPKMTVAVEARDRMEITVTKSFLQLTNRLSAAFEEAAKQISPPAAGRHFPGTAPYVVLNETGIDVVVEETDSLKLKAASAAEEGKAGTMAVPHHGWLELDHPASANRHHIGLKMGSSAEPVGLGEKSELRMRLHYRLTSPDGRTTLKQLQTEREVNVMRAEQRCIHLPMEADSGKKWALLVDTKLEQSRHVVELSSLVRFINHMQMPIVVLAENPVERTHLSACGTARADGTPLHIPLPLVYSTTGDFHFQPEGNTSSNEGDDSSTSSGYDRSNESISWHAFDHHRRHTVRCDSTTDPTRGLYLDLVVEERKVMGEKGKGTVESAYTVHILPPLFFRNLLPVAVEVTKPITRTLEGGDGVSLNLIHPLSVEFNLTYDGCVYTAELRIPRKPSVLETIRLVGKNDPDRELVLALNWSSQQLQYTLSLFAPYWVVNNVNRTLRYSDKSPGHRSSCCSFISSSSSSKRSSQQAGGGGKGQEGTTVRRQESDPLVASHPPGKNPLLLQLREATLFEGKKKIKASLDGDDDGDGGGSTSGSATASRIGWSPEFPLDIPGSAGRVVCHNSTTNRDYDLTVDVQLCQSGLTKVITISPFYILQNASAHDIEVKERGAERWHRCPAESFIGLWPVQTSKRKVLCMRYAGQAEHSIYFPITETFDAFCRIPNSEHLGVMVTCTCGESSSVVKIEPFVPGMVPALLMNATKLPVKYKQAKAGSTMEHGSAGEGSTRTWETLKPGEMRAFTWSDVADTHERLLEWESGQSGRNRDTLQRNEFGDYFTSKTGASHYWVSFLNGRQRVLLFTSDLAVMTTAYEAYEVERMNMQVELNIHGVGISLVNNLSGMEVLYMAMSNSGVVWEEKAGERAPWRHLATKLGEDLEKDYQLWANQRGRPTGFAKFGEEGGSASGMEVDFSTGILRKKAKSEVQLRRNFRSGLWLQHGQSDHQTHLHLKVNHLQVDSQLPACVFPCVLAVITPPKSVGGESGIAKPFIEFSFVQSQSEHSHIVQIKYLHLLVQEFAVRIDSGLIGAAMALFETEAALPLYTHETFAKDMELTKPQLSHKAFLTTSSQAQSYYNYLHISPLMIHLSFSQGGTLGTEEGASKAAGPSPSTASGSSSSSGKGSGASAPPATTIPSELLNVVLKSVGVTITEVQDVVFKLAYFERRYSFFNRQELQGEVQSHYTRQFIKQAYVLILGLDIIGNPFGLVRDLSAGVEDFFYQPLKGVVEGPMELIEGLGMGVQSLVGHTLGGAAGAASRITGTVGKGLAALTLDTEYQRRRQEAINRRPQNFGEGISRGARGMGQGVLEGVTGVVLKPLEGAKEEGVGGFFKGIGKGLVGVVARPASGLVDFASGTLEAVKTIVQSDDTSPLRPPRVILSDRIVRPYTFRDAFGYKIFRDTDHGKLSDSDHFISHAIISDRNVFIVTDKRVLLARRQDIVGTWSVDWELGYGEITEPRYDAAKKEIRIPLKEAKKGFLGIGASRGKLIQLEDSETVERVGQSLKNAYETYG